MPLQISKSPQEAREARKLLSGILALFIALILGSGAGFLYKRGIPPLNDAAATLLGSALGAGLSVWGAYFASLMSQRRRNIDFEEVADEFVSNLEFEGRMLNSMCFDDSIFFHSYNDRVTACRRQGRMLVEAIDFFENHVASAAFGSFDVRLRIAKLSSIVRSERLGLNDEIESEYLINSYAISSKIIVRGCKAYWIRHLDIDERTRADAFDERVRQLCGR